MLLFKKENVVGYNVKFTYKNIYYEVTTTGSGSFKLVKVDSKNKFPRTSDDNDLREYVLLASTALLGTLSSVEGLRVVKNKELCLKKIKINIKCTICVLFYLKKCFIYYK